MFSDGLIRLPNWVRENTGFIDGDLFEIIIEDENKIILERVK